MLQYFAIIRLRVCLAIAVSFFALGAPAFADPDLENFSGLLGTILKSAIEQQQQQQQQQQQERQNSAKLPVGDDNCLRAHNTSMAILANHGISLSDPRVQRLLAQCNQENAAPPVLAQQVNSVPATPAIFAIEGLQVGGYVVPDSPAYKAFKCRPSGDFAGFQWCGRHRSLNSANPPYDEYMTIFHSSANQATLLLQDIIPAYFPSGDVDREIQRLSKRFGQAAHLYNAEPRPEAPHALLAVWGDVVLTPLDSQSREALRNGEQIHGALVVDYLGDAKKSVALGLPIFRIGGGAGYIWGAKYDDSGKGRLRITAVNASLLLGVKPDPAPSGVISYAPVVTPLPTPTVSLAEAAPLKPVASPTVAPPPAATPQPEIRKTEVANSAVPVTGDRVALVIGNSAYSQFAILPNPRKDAELVAETLKGKGFKTVMLLQDANRAEIGRTLNLFSAEADQADWALVYYAGHGIEVGGINYLLPTDVQLKTDMDVQDEAISLDRVLETVKNARKLGMVILDACRDNPFANTMHRSLRSRAISRGLTVPEPPSGIIVVYAAAAGQTANDGKGEHSPFTTALVSRINEAGLEVNLLIPKVTADVYNATEHSQRPYLYGSNLNSEALYFTPPAAK